MNHYQSFIGKNVSVVIDRPLGSKHPTFDMVYPVNYGYLPDTLARDGMEIDAYILGVDIPLKVFEGVVVAAVQRRDDVEDKLIVAAAGTLWSETAIWSAVEFQKNYFDAHIVR